MNQPPMGAPGVNQRSRVAMTPAEVDAFLQERHTMSVASLGADGRVHLVAMWYGFVDGTLAIETKGKSQKAVNFRRDPRATLMVEAGDTYAELRGVELVGTARVIEDWDTLWQIGCSVFGRYLGPVTEETHPAIEQSLNKRVGILFDIDRVVSWDHRKLG